MKNEEYWTKRKANLIYEQMDKAEKQADKFDEIYKQSKSYLDKQINKVFDKFQRDYGLSERDARQVLKNMKDQKDLNELRKVLEARPNDPNIQRLLADLDSPAYAYRMKRLERLNDDLDRMRESIYHSEKTGSDAFYSDLMKDSYYKATFDLQQQTGLAYSFSDLPETEIKRLRGLKWTGEGYSDRIWENTGALASTVKDELLISLMAGRSVRDTSQAIAERFEVGQNKARRLVRTESAFFHNQMELLSYEDAEITKYKFVAVLDKRTSHICQEHDNKVYDTDKAVPGVNYPPLHPWCRSTTIAHDEDIDYSKLERRARNPKTGKVEYVPADMSYNDWYSEYVAKPRERELSGGKFGANLDYVRSDEFVDKLKNHPKTSNLSESIARVSRQILQHRNGTQYEDYYLLDAETGRVVALSNKARKIKGVVYNNQVRKAFKESSEQSLVSIHNHPSGYPPSLSDFASLQQRSKNNTVKYGLTIGHDGSVYWYSKPNKRIHKKANQEYENLIEKMIKLGYTEVKAQEKTLTLFAEKYDFTFERID
ncbi:minor capsid protein [Streptococcus sp. FDAARGOS_256]|uniref:minor capsid protein n=1 Tax=Streptococcus sp. FDAARGOS_256 TaxID=1975706 RepID=UPI00187C42D0|nr:minor capsid protein [Streptococcus sp. FDAARGOS_256]